MAGKANTKATEVTPEVTAEEKPTKVYKFISQNKFLTCTALGVQFMNGTAETTSVEVARELAKISGVQMVEE